ncbi:MAG TPA: OsmC family protein [Verrucomicrobiales bacterium]|nr:OsmC family protein [Verrucomicrobiales bacterium]
MITITAFYEGDLHTMVTHGPSGARLTTDAPRDNEGLGESFSSTDLVAAALATCALTVMGIVARRKNLDIRGARASVQKEMSADSPRRIVRLPVHIEIPLPEDHPERAMLEAAARGCPVHYGLHPDIDRPMTFLWKG